MRRALALSAVFVLGVEKMSRGKGLGEDLGVAEKLWRDGPDGGRADPVIREVAVPPGGVPMAFAELETALGAAASSPPGAAPASLADVEREAARSEAQGGEKRAAAASGFGACTVKLYRGTSCDKMELETFTTQEVSGQEFLTASNTNASSLTRSINVESPGGCRFVEVYDDDSMLSRDDKKYIQPSGCLELPNDLQEDIRGVHLAVQVPAGMERECKFGLYRDLECNVKHISTHSTTEPEGQRFKMEEDARSLPLAVKVESAHCKTLEVFPGMLGGLFTGTLNKQVLESPSGCIPLQDNTKENVAKVFALPNYGIGAVSSPVVSEKKSPGVDADGSLGLSLGGVDLGGMQLDYS